MTWPTEPTRISEIPHLPSDGWKIDMMDQAASNSLLEGMLNMAERLEEITQGDPEKEAILGGLLYTVANRAANTARNSKPLNLRKIV